MTRTRVNGGSSSSSGGNKTDRGKSHWVELKSRQPNRQRHKPQNKYNKKQQHNDYHQQQVQQKLFGRPERQAKSSIKCDNDVRNYASNRFWKLKEGGINKSRQTTDARALSRVAFGGIGFGLSCFSRAARRQRQLSEKVNKLLKSYKNLRPAAQLEIWIKFIDNHPFNLDQFKSICAAINGRIKVDIISNVPKEISRYIMSFLSPKDLCQAAQTCKTWQTICEDNRLWREKCEEEGLLDDKFTLEELFKNKLFLNMERQDNYIRNHLDTSTSSKAEWKKAYLTHLNILRNWSTRKFAITKPNIAVSPLQQQQDNQQDEQPVLGRAQNQSSPYYSPVQFLPKHYHSNQLNEFFFQKDRFLQLRCHEEFVITCLQYNPKTIIVTGSDDHTLKVWCSKSGRCLTTLKGHQGGVWTSALSPTDIVVSGSTDRTLKVWKAQTGELLHTLLGHSSTVRCLALDGDQVVSGSRDTTLRVWNISDGRCVHVLCGHTKAVRCVEYKNDTIVSGAYDHSVMVWNAVTGTCLHTLAEHTDRIYSLQFDGKTIASGSLDSIICIWNANTGELRHRLEGHQSLTKEMQLKGNFLVSANADTSCKVWNVTTGECLHTLGGPNKHRSAILSVYFDNWHVITSSDDGTVKLWDFRTGEFIRNLVVLRTASKSGVVWRIRASYTKLICAVGSRIHTDDTRLLMLDFGDK